MLTNQHRFKAALAGLALARVANAHVVAWAKGMYCGNGTSTEQTLNTNTAVLPLYQLPKDQWWFQHDRGCDAYPPPPGDFLELPAGDSFTVELAHNKGQTEFGGPGGGVTRWPDGQEHPDDWSDPNCIQDDGALHTTGREGAYGTAFAISYTSELSQVTMESLAVFTVLEQTPFKRVATYQVPADMPACPEGGCICAWLWVPNGCGQPNMYMAGYKCKVTGATSTKAVAPAKPAVYCGDDTTKCVKGAKQMLVWQQLDGNNVDPPNGISPGYNSLFGWTTGAQKDIFVDSASTANQTTSTSAPLASSTKEATSQTAITEIVSATGSVAASGPSVSSSAVTSSASSSLASASASASSVEASSAPATSASSVKASSAAASSAPSASGQSASLHSTSAASHAASTASHHPTSTAHHTTPTKSSSGHSVPRKHRVPARHRSTRKSAKKSTKSVKPTKASGPKRL